MYKSGLLVTLILIFIAYLGIRELDRQHPHWFGGGASYQYVYEAKERIPIGTLRDAALELIPNGFWHHEICDRSADVVITDLFFYDSHRFDEAEILIVKSQNISGTYQIDTIGGFEPYAWHAAYQDCYDRSKFLD